MRYWLVLAVLLVGCSDSKEDFEARLVSVARAAPAESGDFWLVKRGLGGEARVALVFGMVDDREFCEDLAVLYMRKYPADAYFCQAAAL